MLSKLSAIAKKLTSSRNILFALALVMAINLLFSIAFKGLEGRIPDTRIWYNSEKVYMLLESFSLSEKQQYTKGILLLDYLYPIVYGLLLIMLLERVKSAKVFFLFPVAAAIFDFLENTSVLIMLTQLPAKLSFLGNLSGYFTLLKWVAVTTSISTVGFYFFKNIIFRQRKKLSG